MNKRIITMMLADEDFKKYKRQRSAKQNIDLST